MDIELLTRLLEPPITKIIHNLRRTLNEAGRARGLNPTQVSALRILYKNEAIRVSEVAAQLDLSNSACSTMLETLDKRGLLDKRLDEEDRRATRVTLSAEGTTLIRSLADESGKRLSEALQKLSRTERYMVLAGMEALADALD